MGQTVGRLWRSTPDNYRALPRQGFPIRTSPDQSLLGSSPRLIAACYVLRRRFLPRHPPCALPMSEEPQNKCPGFSGFKFN